MTPKTRLNSKPFSRTKFHGDVTRQRAQSTARNQKIIDIEKHAQELRPATCVCPTIGDGLAMRQRLVGVLLTVVVALSAAVRRVDDSTSTSTTSGGRHVGHVTLTERYVDRKLNELESRLGRKLVQQATRLNYSNSITIDYLEKVRLLVVLWTMRHLICNR